MEVPIMANANYNQTVGSGSATTIFDSDGIDGDVACSTIKVACRDTSSNGVLVRVTGVNASVSNQWDYVGPGDKEYYRGNHGGVTKVEVKGDGGDAVIDWSVVAKTQD
jgi:hypothetical protein